MLDIGAGLRYACRDATQYPANIFRGYSDVNVKELTRIRCPLNVNPVLRLATAQFSGRLTGVGVDQQTLILAQHSVNRVAWNRLATGRQLDGHSLGTAYDKW